MPENAVDRPFSPFWWMKTLVEEQGKRNRDTYDRLNGGVAKPGLYTLQAWMDNNPPLPEGAPSWKAAYQEFHKDSRTNVAALTVGSAANRMTALGFRTGASGDQDGDDVAARVWAENQMAVEQVDIITDMLGLRYGYTMVAPDDEDDVPVITSEDPRQVITAHDPRRRSRVIAGMKTLHNPYEEIDEVWIYLPAGDLYNPERTTAYRAWKPAGRNQSWQTANFRLSPEAWTWDDPVLMPTRRVPIVRFENRRCQSEFEPHLSILGRINRITLQRMLIGEIQAFRQRAVKGLPRTWPADHPIPELRGKEIDYTGVFDPGPGSLWQVPPDVDFWESQPIDLRPLLDEERLEYRNLSALVGIPVSYFNPDDTNGSAEGASLQRETLIYRVEDRQTIAEAGFNETMSLAFEMMGDVERSDVSRIETIWAPIERLSLTERYQAAVSARTAGMPVRTIWREVLKLTPRQMKAAEDDAADDLIMGRSAVTPPASELAAQQPTRPAPAQPQPAQPQPAQR